MLPPYYLDNFTNKKALSKYQITVSYQFKVTDGELISQLVPLSIVIRETSANPSLAFFKDLSGNEII